MPHYIPPVIPNLTLHFFFSLIFLLCIAPDALSAGYTCPASAKKYTSCKAGYYLNGTSAGNSCSSCSSLGYTSSANGNSNGAAACYKPCTKACTQQTCPTSAYSCTHGSTSTSGTQYYGGSCSAKASTCSLTINSCKAGYYKNGNSCVACPSGYTSNNGTTGGINSCYINVPAGKYIATSGSGSPATCVAGYYNPAHTVYYGNTSSCNKCVGTTYSDTSGASSCKSCPTASQYAGIISGYWYWTDDDIHDTIDGCRAEFDESDSKGSYNYSCGYCNGDYGVSSSCSSSQCMATPPNSCAATYYYTAGSGNLWAASRAAVLNAVCTSVGNGYYSEAGQLTRTQCPAGYRNGPAAASVNGCYMQVSGGHYVAAAKDSAPSTCSAGYYNPAHTVYYGSTSSCNKCVGATYSDTAGATSCTQCPTATKKAALVTSYWYWSADGIQDHLRGCRAQFKESDAGGTYQYGCSFCNGDYGVTACEADTCNAFPLGGASICKASYYNPNTESQIWAGNDTEMRQKLCTSVGSGNWSADGAMAPTQCPAGYRNGPAATSQGGCIGNFTKTGSQVNGSVPSGCASVTSWNACTPGTCTYQKNYAGTITSDCTPTNCTKTPASVTANANRYVSGTTCPACPSGYPNSDGGSGAITSCYSNSKPRAWTGSQTACTKPTGCATVSCNSCSGSACTYVAYSNSAGTGDGTIKSGCSTNNAPCQQTVASVTASANYYVSSSGTTCPACSSYSSTHTLSDGGNISSAYCYRNATKTGSQVNGSVPSGCASVTSWNACTPGTCTYKDYYSATDTTCTPTNCTKTPAAVTAKANYYVSSSGTTCSACSSYSSTHTLSDGGNISSAYCYRNATKTGSQVNGSVPSGCASVTSWNACTPGTCTYKDYYSATDTTCTPTNCTKTPASVTASANRYVSGTTCPACPSGYPNSDGGSGAITSCYSNNKPRAWTGSQTACAKPAGCATVSCNSCSGSACTYVAYSNSAGTGDGKIKSGCSTNNAPCQQTVASVTASANRYVSGTTCPACPSSYPNSAGGNIGQNMCYMTCSEQPISGGTNVPVSNTVYYGNTCTYTTQCHDGYNQTDTNTCSQLCQLGITRLRTTSGITVPLYSEKLSTPSLNIGIDGGVCYGILSSGNGGITIRYNDQTYHAVE